MHFQKGFELRETFTFHFKEDSFKNRLSFFCSKPDKLSLIISFGNWSLYRSMFCKDYFVFSNIPYDKSGCITPLFHTGNEFHPFSLCLSLRLRQREPKLHLYLYDWWEIKYLKQTLRDIGKQLCFAPLGWHFPTRQKHRWRGKLPEGSL